MNEQLSGLYEYFTNPDTWLSVIALVLSIIALFQTNKQIRLSNKQQLFERRLEKYLIFKDLITLYKNHRKLLIGGDSICEMVDIQFSMLTNCSFLEQMCAAIDKPLHDAEHKILLTRLEQLEKLSVEIKLLWSSDVGKKTGDFVKEYRELLMPMYRQQIMLKHLHRQNEEHPILLEEFQQKAKENALHVGLYTNIKKIDITYNDIIETRVEQQLVDSIKL